jgi:nucleotide-binding universal stress UspA family protein
MYKRILLASDASSEGLVALREGALIARTCGARAHLLVIDRGTPGQVMADSLYLCPAPRGDDAQNLLEFGLKRLARLGVQASGDCLFGEPAMAIPVSARSFAPDLIVVGHRRQTLVDRWWSGATGAYLVDGVSCSVLLARDVVSDEEFEAYLDHATEEA